MVSSSLSCSWSDGVELDAETSVIAIHPRVLLALDVHLNTSFLSSDVHSHQNTLHCPFKMLLNHKLPGSFNSTAYICSTKMIK